MQQQLVLQKAMEADLTLQEASALEPDLPAVPFLVSTYEPSTIYLFHFMTSGV